MWTFIIKKFQAGHARSVQPWSLLLLSLATLLCLETTESTTKLLEGTNFDDVLYFNVTSAFQHSPVDSPKCLPPARREEAVNLKNYQDRSRFQDQNDKDEVVQANCGSIKYIIETAEAVLQSRGEVSKRVLLDIRILGASQTKP